MPVFPGPVTALSNANGLTVSQMQFQYPPNAFVWCTAFPSPEPLLSPSLEILACHCQALVSRQPESRTVQASHQRDRLALWSRCAAGILLKYCQNCRGPAVLFDLAATQVLRQWQRVQGHVPVGCCVGGGQAFQAHLQKRKLSDGGGLCVPALLAGLASASNHAFGLAFDPCSPGPTDRLANVPAGLDQETKVLSPPNSPGFSTRCNSFFFSFLATALACSPGRSRLPGTLSTAMGTSVHRQHWHKVSLWR